MPIEICSVELINLSNSFSFFPFVSHQKGFIGPIIIFVFCLCSGFYFHPIIPHVIHPQNSSLFEYRIGNVYSSNYGYQFSGSLDKKFSFDVREQIASFHNTKSLGISLLFLSLSFGCFFRRNSCVRFSVTFRSGEKSFSWHVGLQLFSCDRKVTRIQSKRGNHS